MTRLIAAFLRHGDYQQLQNVPSALQPFRLTRDGQGQAKKGAEMLQSFCQQHSLTIHPGIDSSSLLRAWQSASEIKTQLQSSSISNSSQTFYIDCYDDLCERSVGSAANLTVQQIETILHDDPRFEAPPKNWKSDSHYCLPFQGAESLINSGQRVATHIQQSLSQLKPKIHQDTLKIFIGHGASFRHAAYHLKLLKFDQIAQLSMFHAQPVFFEFSDTQSLQHIAGEWKIRKKKDEHMD